MSVPRATMRLQFHRGFTFDDALPIIPYLSALGISHVYSSPILTARHGSRHGYDIVDPTEVNPELGGEAAFRRLAAALRDAGLGLIVDIVPNHMAVGRENRWWLDVLRNGPQSRYARYFDIDWNPEDPTLQCKVLVPLLGRSLGDTLRHGELALGRDTEANGEGAPYVKYFDHVLPLAPEVALEVSASGLDTYAPRSPQGHIRLQALLERQNYRLAWWRVANDEINWRRFFDINELAALRVEDEEVFEAVHGKALELFTEDLIQGFRVDHIDGLTDPKGYCIALRAHLDARGDLRGPASGGGYPYIVVEKILGAGERLPLDWGCDGTTGYDFMEEISAVLHDPSGAAPLSRLWKDISGRAKDFSDEEQTARREMLDRSFSAQLRGLVLALHRFAREQFPLCDVSRSAIRRSVIEILAGMRVYRTYDAHEESRAYLAAAVERAQQTCLRVDRDVVRQLGEWLGSGGSTDPALPPLRVEAIRRFRQLSAPLAAKAVEDTAFYRYGRLLSRVDVGFRPDRFAISIADFHHGSKLRAETYPYSLLATATHDHKRGEDVRARLAVLSEIPDEWAAALSGWMEQSAGYRCNGRAMISSADVSILFQMIVGAWPTDLLVGDLQGCDAFARRLAEWQTKALREAKLATEWTDPDEAYEAAANDFLMKVFARPSALLQDIVAFADRIAAPGAVNGLAQTLLKVTSPGVPDFYQGTDFWDFSLVDPDNRRPVDFAARASALAMSADIGVLARRWRDGRIKQAIIAESLALRRAHPRLFADGAYVPVSVNGPASDHVVAFARRYESQTVVTVVVRHATHLLDPDDTLTIPAAAWAGTILSLPFGPETSVRNVLTGTYLAASAMRLEGVLDGLPAALLASG
jgi:(1->4)-alpha-D-glucan 1-alpha-D-glucosylmutase